MTSAPTVRSKPWIRKSKRLIADLGIPFVGGLVWAFATAYVKPTATMVELIGAGSSAAFFVGWLWRIFAGASKKIDDDDRHEAVVTAQQNLLKTAEKIEADLQVTAKKIESYATGGDSFAYAKQILAHHNTLTSIVVFVEGEFPLYETRLTIKDLNSDFSMEFGPRELYEAIYGGVYEASFPPLINSTFQELKLGFVLPDKDHVCFAFNWNARNGHWTQRVELFRVGLIYRVATYVRRGHATENLYSHVDEDFPQHLLHEFFKRPVKQTTSKQ